MNTTMRQTLLVLAAAWLAMGTAARAKELRYSDIEQRLSRLEQQQNAKKHPGKSSLAFLSDNDPDAAAIPEENDEAIPHKSSSHKKHVESYDCGDACDSDDECGCCETCSCASE